MGGIGSGGERKEGHHQAGIRHSSRASERADSGGASIRLLARAARAIQGSASAERWTLGCVNPASWLPMAAGGELTQPRARAHLLADPCILPKWA